MLSWAEVSHHCFLLTPWRFSGSLCSIEQLTTSEKAILVTVYKGCSWKINVTFLCLQGCVWGHTGTPGFGCQGYPDTFSSCAGVKAELCLLTSAEDSAFMVSMRSCFKSHAATAAEADQKWSGLMLCWFFVLGCRNLGTGVSNNSLPRERGKGIPNQTKHSGGGNER